METDDYLPLSGLQHLLFCERQCALIHVERLWVDNHLTIEGNHLHERADLPGVENRAGVRIARRLQLVSHRIKLTGYADIVEFHASPEGEIPFPVEYKRGKRKAWLHDEVQLCAQALCLEETLGRPVPRGALYYGASRRRLDVELTSQLRENTERAAARFHALFANREVPRAEYEPKCDNCSLLELCMPRQTATGAATNYLRDVMKEGAL
jgi:CRISPR-associated exonuclease Cas4